MSHTKLMLVPANHERHKIKQKLDLCTLSCGFSWRSPEAVLAQESNWCESSTTSALPNRYCTAHACKTHNRNAVCNNDNLLGSLRPCSYACLFVVPCQPTVTVAQGNSELKRRLYEQAHVHCAEVPQKHRTTKDRTSTYFLALSQALPVLDMETAICTPETRAPARTPASVRVPKRTPTTTGVSMTKQPGGIISDRDACSATHNSKSDTDMSNLAMRTSCSECQNVCTGDSM